MGYGERERASDPYSSCLPNVMESVGGLHGFARVGLGFQRADMRAPAVSVVLNHLWLAHIGNNRNRIARRANTHKGAVEVIGHLVAIGRTLAVLGLGGYPDRDAR